jgi:hypothetical protein
VKDVPDPATPRKRLHESLPHQHHHREAVPAKPAAADSVPPPPVVSDQAPDDNGRLVWAVAKLGWSLRPSSRGRFFRARVSLLLGVLGLVLLWAGTDCYERRARTAWRRPLNVALVLVERKPIGTSTIGLFDDRTRALERRLASEYERHVGRDFSPLSFVVKGPLRVEQDPPSAEQGALGLLRYSYALFRWTREIDARAHVERGAYDARIYLVMEPASPLGPAFVEGESEFGGRIGIAKADIDPSMIDFSLFVVAHELMHTLGASDKYDSSGNAVYPDGFAEPQKVPLYPQRGAEIMARDLPLTATFARPPNTLDELFVGNATAREIGWEK